MLVEQIYDKGLAQASYIIESEGKIALVDPARDPRPFEEYAKKRNAKIVAVFETHPHADFTSSHLEFAKRHGATIYVNPKMAASYDHVALDDGQEVEIGKVKIKAKFTPGHSPDHNTYILYDENGKEHAVFTGDSLFIGDVGRPDLREGAGNVRMNKEELAEQMYDTVRNFYQKLHDDVLVYPAHGAGSACGKNLSSETISTIGKQREENWAMKTADREAFVQNLLEDQPVAPKYFPYDVTLNLIGLEDFGEAVKKVKREITTATIPGNAIVVDVRSPEKFKKGHLPGAINIPNGGKFENWLGTIISPDERFYLLSDDEAELEEVIKKSAKIGYEKLILSGIATNEELPATSSFAPFDELQESPRQYTIVDVRNESEVQEQKPFANSRHIPLARLRDRMDEIPGDKPVAVHCAAGYRSAIAASLIERAKNGKLKVLDIGENIKKVLK